MAIAMAMERHAFCDIISPSYACLLSTSGSVVCWCFHTTSKEKKMSNRESDISFAADAVQLAAQQRLLIGILSTLSADHRQQLHTKMESDSLRNVSGVDASSPEFQREQEIRQRVLTLLRASER